MFEEEKVAAFISELWKDGAVASKLKACLSVLEVTKRVVAPSRPPLLEYGLIKSLLEAAKVDRPQVRDSRPFFDPRLITELWHGYKANSRLTMLELRWKTLSLLVVDLFLRGADAYNFTEEGTHLEAGTEAALPQVLVGSEKKLLPEKSGVKSVFCKVGGLKEHRSQHILWSYFRVPCICKAGFSASCTCCALVCYLNRSKARRAKTAKSEIVLSDGSTFKARRLFVTHSGPAGPLSLDRLRNDMRDIRLKCGLGDWKTHSIRGAAASKCINMGVKWQRVLDHGRWASAATFKRHYLRLQFYAESSTEHEDWPIWKILRKSCSVIDHEHHDHDE